VTAIFFIFFSCAAGHSLFFYPINARWNE